jgi:hypothetical protein
MDLGSALTGKPAEGASATDILRADHAEVARLFSEYASKLDDAHAAHVIAQTLCMELELHDTIEREVFYPAIVELDSQRVERAFDAHSEIAGAVADVRRRADADEPLRDAVAELQRLVERHLAEEEQRLFPRVEQEPKAALRELGAALVTRKEELTRTTRSFEAPAT